jgi:hypothetical protein
VSTMAIFPSILFHKFIASIFLFFFYQLTDE